MFIRRVFAWPALAIGAALTFIGGAFIRFSAWALDIYVERK